MVLAQSDRPPATVCSKGETDHEDGSSTRRVQYEPSRQRLLWGPNYEAIPVMVAYGRTVVAKRSGIAHWTRTTRKNAPTIVLDLRADSITVRDYPARQQSSGRDGDRITDPLMGDPAWSPSLPGTPVASSWGALPI